MLVEYPCTHIKWGYFWVDESRCWAASKPSAVSFLNSSLSFSLFQIFKKCSIILFKPHQGSWWAYSERASVAKISSPHKRDIFDFSEGKEPEKRNWPFYRFYQNPTLLFSVKLYMCVQTHPWMADLSLSLLVSKAILLSCGLFSREIACSALAGVSFGVTPTKWHLSSLFFMGW